jgi:7-cyano-7-deazaguanine synthase
MNRGDALLLLSGGQDSTTCLLWAMADEERFSRVHVVAFDYGQRHAVELAQASSIVAAVRGWKANRIGIVKELKIPALEVLAGAALTNPAVPVEQEASEAGGNAYAAARGLPSTFVPGRNTILIGTAAAMAGKLGAQHIIAGICGMDRAGYPDCRAEYASALETTLRLGLDWPELTLHTPLMFATKADTWRLAEAAAGTWGVELVRECSHTCYEGVRDMDHPWGYGCGECPACLTRAEGWAEYKGLVAA